MFLKALFIVCFFSLTSLFGSVGFSMTSFEDEERDREIPVFIWYPTEEEGFDSMFGENVAFVGFEATEEAEMIEKKLPLYVLVHGTNGNWRNLSWLGAKLAKNAFVVAASHPDFATGQANAKTILRPWKQPQDVSFIIKSMKAEFEEYLSGKVYVIGHSFGGYSALALAGAKMDLSKMGEFCEKRDDELCKHFAKEGKNITQEDIKNSKMDLKDSEITKVIALTPAFIPMMTKESLGSISTPTLIITAKFDKNVPPMTYFEPYKSDFSKQALHVNIKDAGHFSFLQLCKKGAKELLAKENSAFVCDDGEKGKSREAIHEETLKAILDFSKE